MTTYEVIQHQEVGAGGAASITFSNIPQTYTDLQLVVSPYRAGTTGGLLYIRFNNSTTNYSARYLEGTGSSVSSNTDQPRMIGYTAPSSNTANTFGSSSTYIPNYTSSNYKTWSSDGVSENNSTASYQAIIAGLWSVTDPITSITVERQSGYDLAQYSSATLIGIKSGSDGITSVA